MKVLQTTRIVLFCLFGYGCLVFCEFISLRMSWVSLIVKPLIWIDFLSNIEIFKLSNLNNLAFLGTYTIGIFTIYTAFVFVRYQPILSIYGKTVSDWFLSQSQVLVTIQTGLYIVASIFFSQYMPAGKDYIFSKNLLSIGLLSVVFLYSVAFVISIKNLFSNGFIDTKLEELVQEIMNRLKANNYDDSQLYDQYKEIVIKSLNNYDRTTIKSIVKSYITYLESNNPDQHENSRLDPLNIIVESVGDRNLMKDYISIFLEAYEVLFPIKSTNSTSFSSFIRQFKIILEKAKGVNSSEITASVSVLFTKTLNILEQLDNQPELKKAIGALMGIIDELLAQKRNALRYIGSPIENTIRQDTKVGKELKKQFTEIQPPRTESLQNLIKEKDEEFVN